MSLTSPALLYCQKDTASSLTVNRSGIRGYTEVKVHMTTPYHVIQIVDQLLASSRARAIHKFGENLSTYGPASRDESEA